MFTFWKHNSKDTSSRLEVGNASRYLNGGSKGQFIITWQLSVGINCTSLWDQCNRFQTFFFFFCSHLPSEDSDNLITTALRFLLLSIKKMQDYPYLENYQTKRFVIAFLLSSCFQPIIMSGLLGRIYFILSIQDTFGSKYYLNWW